MILHMRRYVLILAPYFLQSVCAKEDMEVQV